MAGEYITPGDWVKAVRTMRFGVRRGVRPSTIRDVAYTLASYAEYDDGTRIFPGVALLAVHSEVDYRTARTVLAILRDDLELVTAVRAGRRRGHADEYRLSMPEDIVDRIQILSPADVELAVERIRGANRKPATSGTGVAGTRTEPAEKPPQGAVRVSPVPVPEDSTDSRTGVAGTGIPGRTGVAGTAVRVSPCPPTEPLPRHQLLPNHSDEDLRTDVSGSRATAPHEDQDSSEVVDPPARAVGRARVPAPTRCGHGFAITRRPDGSPGCTLCRRDAVRGGTTAMYPTIPPPRDPDERLADVIQFQPRSAS